MTRREVASARALHQFDGWRPRADSWERAVDEIWQAAREEFADEIEALCEDAERVTLRKHLTRDYRDLIYAYRLRKAIKRPKKHKKDVNK